MPWGSCGHALGLALLCACARAQGGAGDVDVAVVRSAADLRFAIQAGRRHIELQQHVDLTDEPTTTSSYAQKPIFRLEEEIKSIRGNCTQPPQWQLASELLPGQCVLLTDANILLPAPLGVRELWLDRLYVLARGSSGGAANTVVPIIWDGRRDRLWVTNSTFEGNGQDSTALWVLYGSKAFLGDVRVLRQRAPVAGIDAKHTNTTVALQRVAFGPNTAPGANSVDLAVFDSAAAVLHNASFSDDGTVDIDKRFGSVYAATPAAYWLRAGSDPVQPLSALPQNLTFLGGRDPELLLIQEEALRGRVVPVRTTPSPAPAAATASPEADVQSSDTAGSGSNGDAETRALSDSDSPSVVAPVVGGAVGAVVLSIALATLALLWARRRNRSEHVPSKDPGGAAKHFQGEGQTGPGARGGASQTQPLQSRRITSHPVPHDQPLPGAPTTASRTRSRYGTTSELTQSTNTETGAPLTVLATQRHAPSLDEILAAETQQERLSRVVAAMAASQPPELFAGRFLLTPEQRGGGQATVHFARSGTGGFFQYAVKFFNRVQDYRIEEELYGDAAAKAVLPQLFASSSNEDGAACSRGGYRFPPFLVMERGMTLTEWLSQGASRTPLAVLSMFADCAALLVTLHAHGHVHRDLKPDNVLLMLQSQAWCFIDFGIAAPAGSVVPPACTPSYAAPETAVAFAEKRLEHVTPAVDVFALGVVVFECFTGSHAISPLSGPDSCVQLARGERRYPWEELPQSQDRAFGGSRARKVVEACLERDADKRPSAEALVEAIRLITNRTEVLS